MIALRMDKIAPVLPVTMEDPSGQMAANVALCVVTMDTSNQLLGNIGVSVINMRIKETAMLKLLIQNKEH